MTTHKLVAILIIVLSAMLPETLCGQSILETNISLEADQEKLSNVLQEIEKQANVKFVYSGSYISTEEIVSVTVHGKKLREILDKLLVPRRIAYNVQPNSQYIVLTTLKSNMSTVTGSVLETGTKQPLQFANVFVNSTTIGMATDENGLFKLSNIPFGKCELIVSYVGYKTMRLSLTINARALDLGNIILEPEEQVLQSLEVKSEKDKKWDRQLEKFKKIFLGDNDLAAQCTIENPWVIEFSDDEKGKQLAATASAPIVIKNKALGYKVHFYLQDFWKSSMAYLIKGHVRFEELVPTNEAEQAKWKQNRESAYKGSSQHLLKAVVHHRIKGEGFYLYTERPGLENATARTQFFEQELKINIEPYDTANLVFPGEIEGTYKIVMPGRIEVHNHNERAIVRTYRDIRYPVSWIKMRKDTVTITEDGIPLDAGDVITSGDMNEERVAHMLPTNYKPGASISYAEPPPLLYENVYLHTDKPYYYPGETIWFKAYMRYADVYLYDSLSKVLYVELINDQRKIVASRIAEIATGQASGDFTLPDSLATGNYYLRAYTNWMRNFGDQNLFVRPVPVLDLTQRADSHQALKLPIQGNVIIQSDKDTYATREKINLTFSVHDKAGNPVTAFMSVSVTDASQVVPVPEMNIMAEGIPFNEIDKENAKEFKFPLERGIRFEARYFNKQHVPEKQKINLIEWNSREVIEAEADVAGFFNVEDLFFYDSARFSLIGKDKKESEGSIETMDREEPPPVDFFVSPLDINIEQTQSPQRVISAYEKPEDVRLLESVEIKGKKMDNSRIRRPYGIVPSVNIIRKEDIRPEYGNLIYSMIGRVPGLLIQQAVDGWNIKATRAAGLSGSGGEPLVTINDVPMSGNAGEILSNINPNTVESIEVSKGINVLYGSQGAFGVISIYTKDYMSNLNPKEEIPDMPFIKEPGFTPLRQFKSPQYDQKNTKNSSTDYRSTLYWNPNVITDEETGIAEVSFFAADLETTYRVVVEGITASNHPVRGEYYLTIHNN